MYISRFGGNSMNVVQEKWYSVEELAQILKLNQGSIRQLVRSGKLKSVKFGRMIRIPDSSFQDYVNHNLKSTKDNSNNDDKTQELLSLAGKWIGPKKEYDMILKAIEESQLDTEF
jgi:excisionase family DNA binding protein